MSKGLEPGRTIPDFELPDENGELHRLSDLQGEDAMVLMLGRGEHCPRERMHQREMVRFHEWCDLAFTRLVTILPNEPHDVYKLRISSGAHWPFLCDEKLEVRSHFEIDEYTDDAPRQRGRAAHADPLARPEDRARSTSATGSPLLVDPRLEPHARGALHRRLLGRGRGLRLVHDQLRRRPGRPTARCRSCTGSAASTTSPSASCRTCAAGATRARARRQRRLGPDAARRLRRAAQHAAPLPRAARASCTPRSRRSSPTSPTPRRGAGARRRRACGRCAATRATTCPRRSCAGRRSTAR